LLLWMRTVTFCFTVLVTLYAMVFRRQHLQDGRERLPGDPGGGLHPAAVRLVLAPRHQPGRAGLDLLRRGVWLAVHIAGGEIPSSRLNWPV
jgi:hypothetical protein